MAVGVGAIVAAAVLLPAAPARANVRSQALYARGLVPFDRGQWEQAYRLFDQAVQADTTDAMAVYYRGLTQARRGMRAAAIKDIEQALQLDPVLPHAALDVGIAYFDETQYAPARIWLERAYQQGSERFTAAFFLGLSCYRLGDDAAAQKYLNEAQADPDLRVAAQYYAGLALLRQGETQAGRAALQRAAREQPQSEIGKAAQRAIAGKDVRQPPAAVPPPREKPWSLSGEFGFQFDTNVPIAPSDSGVKVAQGVGRESDSRVTVSLGGEYLLLDTDAGSLRAEYDFYQSVHFNLTEFDLQGHRVRLDAASGRGPWSYGLSGVYDFYALDYQTFFQEGLGTPWVAFACGDRAVTQAYYTLRGRDFFRKPYDPARDAINNAFGVRQLVAFDAHQVVSFGYQFDGEDTVADGPGARDFRYNANQADLSVAFPAVWLVHVQAGYLFRLEDYRSLNSRTAFTARRHDNEHQFVVALERELSANVAVGLDYFAVINNSNIADFEYDRHIVAASVRLRF